MLVEISYLVFMLPKERKFTWSVCRHIHLEQQFQLSNDLTILGSLLGICSHTSIYLNNPEMPEYILLDVRKG